MNTYDEIAKHSNAAPDVIQSYREHFRGTHWSLEEKLALAALFASHNVDEGDVEGFAAAYGDLTYNHLIEKEQQPGQGVTEVNREILELILENRDELDSLLEKSTSLVEKDKN